ncbi:MAG: hypothetical protein IH924_11255 [Proteobacteria bacterium]|nr:hypothetical protein [Pseudomonadota bacterium]
MDLDPGPHETMDLDPSEIAGWDAWDDYLSGFDSVGDTPIIAMISGFGDIESLTSQSGEIYLPERRSKRLAEQAAAERLLARVRDQA